ncbi:MAG: ATP-binding protein [Bacteroidetes bacterium]|nr:MAG: ATP-binding protein [Bacteroidota bacterium]
MAPRHYIINLISEGEHQLLDFKFEISDAHKIARSLSAFANTDGGRLLVGVKDNGSIAGVRSDEEYYMLDAAANLYCLPPVPFEARTWTLTGKTVLEVIVPKSDKKPHFAEDPARRWAAYIRVRDQNFPVNRVLLKVWEREHEPRGTTIRFTNPEQSLLSYLERHDSITISKFIRLAGLTRYKAEQILIRFISLRIIAMEFTEQGVLYRLVPDK